MAIYDIYTKQDLILLPLFPFNATHVPLSSQFANLRLKIWVLEQNIDQTPSFKKCRPKELNKLARPVQPVHQHPSVRRPAAVRLPRPLPPRQSFRRPGTSTVSPSRFGRNTFARNFSISPNYQSYAAPTRSFRSTGKM